MADDVTLQALDPFYRIVFHDGTTFEASGDATRMREAVRKLSPQDVAGYDAYFRESERMYRVGFEQLGRIPFSTIADMVHHAPALARLRADRSVFAHVARHIRDPRLRMALSFHPLFIGGNPFRVTAIYSLIAFLERAYGVHYVMGGIGHLAHALADLAVDQGVDFVYNTEVDEILTDKRRVRGVRLSNRNTYPADVVVSNACTAWTHSHLLRNGPRRRWTDRRLAKARYSMSLFVWYFGTRGTYPHVLHHTILMTQRYKELLADIFDRKILAPDFSVYLHRPSATDPSVAPPGHDAFYVLAPVPHLDAGIDWDRQAEIYRAAIAAHLEETLLPDLRDRIVTSRVMTPNDFQTRYLSMKGAAFGMEPLLTQSAWFRPHNKNEDVDGLFLVGAGTHPGAGLPGVITSARVLEDVVPPAEVWAHER